jgi:6-phosphofructokinase 1
MGYDLAVIGIPKTIDNDLKFVDHTPGFGSTPVRGDHLADAVLDTISCAMWSTSR